VKLRLAIATLVTAGAAFVLPVSAAHAATCADGTVQGDYGCPSTQVVGTGGSPAPAVQGTGAVAPTPAAPVAPAAIVQAATAPSGSSLPLTGGDVASLSLIGLALLGGGVVLVRRTRHQPSKTKS
jgi:LPXTG-motif cell wall-anchored protein